MSEFIKRFKCMLFHPFKKEKMQLISRIKSEYACKKCGCDWFVYY